MATPQLATTLRRICTFFDARSADHLGDAELLTRFAVERDEAAFEALVRRHGPLVLGLCRRVLRDPHAADDVFQATFLVLAVKAAAVRKRASVGSWLCGVAYRLACRACGRLARQQAVERDAARQRSNPEHLMDADNLEPIWTDSPAERMMEAEERAAIDAELARLPEKYRAPLVLTYLEGKPLAEAVRQLGWATGTYRSRLTRGRELLRARLRRRGLVVGAAVLSTMPATVALAAPLVRSTTQAAVAFAAGNATAGTVPAAASALASDMLRTLMVSPLKALAVATLTFGLLVAGAVAYGPADDKKPDDRKADNKPAVGTEKAAVDRHDDPLPPGATARLGTVRWRHGGSVGYVTFIDKGKAVLSTGHDGTFHVWETATGKPLARYGEAPAGRDMLDPFQFQRVVSVSTDGGRLATASGKAIRVWDLKTGKELHKLESKDSFVSAMALSRDGATLYATGEDDQVIRRWDLKTGKELEAFGKRVAPPPGAGLPFGPGVPIAPGIVPGVIPPAPAPARDLPVVPPPAPKCGADDQKEDKKEEKKEDKKDAPPPVVVVPGAPGIGGIGIGGGGFAGCFAGGSSVLLLSPDDKLLVTVGYGEPKPDGSVDIFLRVRNAATGKEERRVKSPTGVPTWPAPVFAPATNVLAWGGHEGVIHLTDMNTGKEVAAVSLVENKEKAPEFMGIGGFAFGPEGKALLVNTMGETAIREFDAATGKQKRTFGKAEGAGEGLNGFIGGVMTGAGMAVSPDGKLLARVGHGHTIRLIDLGTGKDARPALEGHQDSVMSVRASDDGKQVTTIGQDGAARQWDLTGKPVRATKVPAGIVNVSAWGPGRAAGFDNEGQTRVWDTDTGKEIGKYAAENGAPWFPVGFTPDGTGLLARGALDNRLRILDVKTGKEKAAFGAEAAAPDGFPVVPEDPFGGGSWGGAAFTPNGRVLALPERGGVTFFDAANGKELIRCKPVEKSALTGGVFTPDGSTFVGTLSDETLILWETATGKERARLGTPKKQPANPNGEVPGGVVDLPLVIYDGFGMNGGNAIAVSPDGRLVARAGSSPVVRVWDLVTGKERAAFEGHTGSVTSLAFTPDGKSLVSGSSDTTALVWDLAAARKGLDAIARDLGEKELEAAWKDLGGEDSGKAYKAIIALAAAQKPGVALLEGRLKAVAEDKDATKFITDLDAEEFAVRQKASDELEKLGVRAAPALKKAMESSTSAEVRKRCEELLARVGGSAPVGDDLRSVRAVEVLERAATPEARALLKKLADGTPDAAVTRSAKEALSRLGR